MRRVLVVTWALGTASGVLLGLFGVQLVSSRFSTARVSPLSHPEVLRALQAARSVPVTTGAPDAEIAAPAPAPGTADPPTSPPTDAGPARPSAGPTSPPAPASPASALPRAGAAAGSLADPGAAAAAVPASPSTTTTATVPATPPSSSTTATTAKPDTKARSKTDQKKSTAKPSTTATTARKSSTSTTSPKAHPSGRAHTKTLRSRGGVVTVTWSNGKVKGVARPESGYEVRFVSNGPDKVEVWFWTDGKASQVQAFADGDTRVTDWRCSNRPRFSCDEV